MLRSAKPALEPTPSPFDPMDQTSEAQALAGARAQAEAGKLVPIGDVARWLDSWGTEDELPPPPWK